MKNKNDLIYPKTRKVDQTDDYFGTKISDPYRWLEDDTSEEVGEWVNAQNALTARFLSQIPFRKQLCKRLQKLMNYTRYSVPKQDGDLLTFSKNEGLQNQPVLYVQKGENGQPRVLINPNKFSDDGTTALLETAFSKTQKYFAYAIATSGSDWQEIRVLDFRHGKNLDDRLSHIKFTTIQWLGDDGFYYSGFDAPQNTANQYREKTQSEKLFYHRIGTPQANDEIIYEDTEHPLRYVNGQLTEDERFLILNISEGTDGVEIRVRDLQGEQNGWHIVVTGFSTNGYIVDNQGGGRLLLYTNREAPNYQLVEINLAGKITRTIIPETTEKLEAVSTGGGFLFAHYLKDVAAEIKQFDREGALIRTVSLPGLGTVEGFQTERRQTALFYAFSGYNYPTTIFRYNFKTGVSSVFQKPDTEFDTENYESIRLFYPSKDGTKIPLFLTYKKGLQRNGHHPVMLYAYGGFNINLTPTFSPMNQVFLDHGGIYAVANLRGGGEYGEKWHQAGMLEHKQNVFDDFMAAAEFLIAEKYTCSKKLAIWGRSNGGLLIGACITQRPELFAVAIPQVGVMDMLRFHKFTVGWGWVPEYGSSDQAKDFTFLRDYSPLHQLKKGVHYPATLVTTGDHDDRVVPAHSFKFAATLQDCQGGTNPTLIRIDSAAGHGLGKPVAKLIDEQTDLWAFVFDRLGMCFTDL